MRKLHTGIGSAKIKGLMSCYGTFSGRVLRENSLGVGKATKLYWLLLKCESSINVLRALAVMTN